MYEEPRKNDDNMPFCEECGRAYHYLLKHVIQSHDMTSKEYREKHNLHPRKSILSDRMRQQKTDKIYENYHSTVQQLAKARKDTQFKKGNKIQRIRWEREKKKPGPELTAREMIAKMAKSGGGKKTGGLTGRLVTKN